MRDREPAGPSAAVHFLPNANQPPFPRAGRGPKPKPVISIAKYLRRKARQAYLETGLTSDERAKIERQKAMVERVRAITSTVAEEVYRSRPLLPGEMSVDQRIDALLDAAHSALTEASRLAGVSAPHVRACGADSTVARVRREVAAGLALLSRLLQAQT